MSYGRRLTLFFGLIVLAPTLALLGVLLILSEDSRRGKADARLATGLETALALYEDRVTDAGPVARRLATTPALVAGVSAADSTAIERFIRGPIRFGPADAVEVTDEGGVLLAAQGSPEAIAFSEIELQQGGTGVGVLRASTTTAEEYAAQVERLTKRELVVSRAGTVVAATVQPPDAELEPGETVDLEAEGEELRGHLLSLSSDGADSLLLMGPRKLDGFLAIDRTAAILLLGFLLVAVGFAYTLARSLGMLHARVAEEAVTDPLTGLWNRRRLYELLEDEVARANRFGHPLSLLILDIDDFKSINDRLGHPQGDIVLRSVATAMKETIRSIDQGGRHGGDELALILIETGARGAGALAERLRAMVREMEIPLRSGGSMSATISVGVATLPDSATEVEALIEAADQALLRAKRTGKDQTKIAGKRRKARRPGRRRANRRENPSPAAK